VEFDVEENERGLNAKNVKKLWSNIYNKIYF
jgi:hypothetical protein